MTGTTTPSHCLIYRYQHYRSRPRYLILSTYRYHHPRGTGTFILHRCKYRLGLVPYLDMSTQTNTGISGTTDRPAGRYRTAIRRVLLSGVGIATVIASFIWLTDLAVHAGWRYPWAYLLPVCIDLFGAAALYEYRISRKRSASVSAWAAISVSMAGNSFSHLYTSGHLTPNWMTVTLVGAIPSVSFGVLIHLIAPRKAEPAWQDHTDYQEESGQNSHIVSYSDTTSMSSPPPPPRQMPRQTGGVPAVGASGSGVNRSRQRRPSRPFGELIAEVWERGLADEPSDRLAQLLGCSKGRAVELRREVRRQLSVPDSPRTLVGPNGSEPL